MVVERNAQSTSYLNRNLQKPETRQISGPRTPDQPEIFMDKLICQYKYACIRIFPIGPTMKKIWTFVLTESQLDK